MFWHMRGTQSMITSVNIIIMVIMITYLYT